MQSFSGKKLLFGALAFLALAFVLPAEAATFRLSPASGNIIAGCATTFDILLSTEGAEVSNAAQIYIDHNLAGAETISLNSAGLFGSYGVPTGLPVGRVGLYGYGGNISGANRRFGTATVRSNNIGHHVNLVIFFDNSQSITSKIADVDSNNILTGVTSGGYDVVFGYCEHNAPYLTALNPPPDKPNHPVAQDIIFNLNDDSSGVDISTLQITVKQNNISLPIVVSTTKQSDLLYNVVIDPVSNLTPELKVEVNVIARDKAGNEMNRTYSFNDLTCAQLGCVAGGVTPQCNDGLDNDGDGLIDFPADSDCESAIDNSEFGSGGPVLQCPEATTTTGGTCSTQCSDGLDNDGDGLIDMVDPECHASSDNSEYRPGEIQCPLCVTTTPAGGGVLNINVLSFWLSGRTIPTAPNAIGIVENLVSEPFTVMADVNSLRDQITEVSLVLGDKRYEMFYDNGQRKYAADVTMPPTPAVMSGLASVTHGDSTQDLIPFTLSVLPKGVIAGQTQTGSAPLKGATVSLKQRNASGNFVVVKKITTNAQGEYGFVVPAGSFRVSVDAAGYRSVETASFSQTNHIVNRIFTLIPTVDLLNPDVSLLDKANYLSSVAEDQAAKLLDSRNSPEVKQAAEQNVAPIAAAATLAALLPTLLSLLSYLRFLFLQPIFLFGRRKRGKWGIVYNSLTKLPVDLAVVRLVDVKTGRVVQTRVTDRGGRYAFFADPGLYRIEVTKQGFIFPTKVLQDFKEDTGFVDLYHGEAVHVDQQYTTLTANIPLDPIGVKEKTPRRIIWERRWREFQSFIASLGMAAGLLAMFISPTVWTIGLFVLQVILYFLFKRLGTTKKPKNWGIVYDKSNQKPLDRVVARLFSKQFNKLVATGFTDKNGRYSFMVGPNQYYVTFEKDGYAKQVSPEISIKEPNEVIKIDVGLDKEIKQ